MIQSDLNDLQPILDNIKQGVADGLDNATARICRLFMDGDQWCARLLDFVNLQESPAGFGDTKDAAIGDLLTQCRQKLRDAFERARIAERRRESLLYDPRPYKPSTYAQDKADAISEFSVADRAHDAWAESVASLESVLAARQKGSQ